jgi:hypothetical protein
MEKDTILSVTLGSDSVSNQINTINYIAEFPKISTIQNFYYVATIVIALVNIALVFYIFFRNNKKEIILQESTRKINLLKTLVLDYNMSKFYEYFKNLIIETQEFNRNNTTVEQKKASNDNIVDLTACFRRDFIVLFIAIDKSLYDKILIEIDSLIDSLTETLFDEGINLSHKPKFDELIVRRLNDSKIKILNVLFSYSGEGNQNAELE